MNDIYGVIYCALNVVNGKRYVGQTIRELRIRKKQHVSESRQKSNSIFHRAINKYGEESFEWSIIDIANSPKELDEKELYWIEKYSTYGSCGYNMTTGGRFLKLTENNRDELSLMSGGRKFLVFDLDGNFIKSTISQTAFAQEIGVDHTAVNNVLLGIKSSTKNMILIFEEGFSEDKLNEIVTRIKDRHKEFAVFNVSGEFVGIWNNKAVCSREIKASLSAIKTQLNDVELANKARKFRFYYIENIPRNNSISIYKIIDK